MVLSVHRFCLFSSFGPENALRYHCFVLCCIFPLFCIVLYISTVLYCVVYFHVFDFHFSPYLRKLNDNEKFKCGSTVVPG